MLLKKWVYQIIVVIWLFTVFEVSLNNPSQHVTNNELNDSFSVNSFPDKISTTQGKSESEKKDPKYTNQYANRIGEIASPINNRGHTPPSYSPTKMQETIPTHLESLQNPNGKDSIIPSKPRLVTERIEENKSVHNNADGEKNMKDNEVHPWVGEVDTSNETIQSEIPKDYVRPYEAPHVAWNKTSTQIGPQYSQYCLPKFGTLPTNQYDYDNITYPIPFNQLYSDHRTHYVNYGMADPRFPSYIGLGDVSDDSFNEDNLVVVTGSSENHLLANVNMMYSVIYTNCELPIVFVDFGLEEEGLEYLIRNMKIMHRIHLKLNSTAKLYYRKFDFTHFPEWVDINDRELRGAYTWKVVSYFDVLNQTKRMIVWSDGGNLWSHSIMKDTIRMAAEGLFTPYSGDSLQRWVHGKSKEFLKHNKMVRKIFDGKGMCTGGYILVNYYNAKAMNDVIFPLLQCAYTRKCISPLNTSRKNHRQDQAILSALVHSAKLYSSCGRFPTTMGFHKDCHEKSKCITLRKKIIKSISHRYRLSLHREENYY